MGELDVLLEHLDERMGEGIVDAEDALELAILAGLATRLGGTGEALDRAAAWREEGRELLTEAFENIDFETILGELDAVLLGGVEIEVVEDALYEIDDHVAAAVWAGQRRAVRAAAIEAARTIREVPEPFAPLAEYASQMAKSAEIAADLDLYEYWLAVADAGQWQDPG